MTLTKAELADLLFEQRWLNDAVGRACATVQGLSMRTYRVIHRLHHNHLYGPQDPDIALHGGYPRGKAYLASKLAKDIDMGEGTIYPLMRRMQSDGLVETYLVESQSGPPRKYYRLTAAGRAQLAELDDYWTRINRHIASLGR